MAKNQKGLGASVVVAREQSFDVLPETPQPYRMRIESYEVAGGEDLSDDPTFTGDGDRNPSEPDEGPFDVNGSTSVPVDAHMFGWWLLMLLGDPVSLIRAEAAVLTNGGAAADKGSGKVGLPSPGHGLAAGRQVRVDGTDSYDGVYVVDIDTSADELVIVATYVSESFDGDEIAEPVLQVSLDAEADARDAGDGKVGLPATGHGLPPGAEITVAGTTSYDATYIVLAGTTVNELLVTATYVSETFDGTETATAFFWDKTYNVPSEQPSFSPERWFPTRSRFYRNGGCKISGLKLDANAGAGGSVMASMDVMGASEDRRATALYGSEDTAPVIRLPYRKFLQKRIAVQVNGAAVDGKIKSFGVNLNPDLEGDDYTFTSTPGAKAVRGSLDEGPLIQEGTLSALFKDTVLADMAETGARGSFRAVMDNSPWRITWFWPEVRFATKTPPIRDKKGVVLDLDWRPFNDTNSEGTSMVVTLRNEIKEYL